MTIQPTLTTERLVLRPFHIGDCQQVALLAGDKRIADMTANIPHPYELPMAQAWIARHAPMYQQHQGVAYAITLRNTGELLGAVSLPRIEEGVRNIRLLDWRATLGKRLCIRGLQSLTRICSNAL